MILIYIYLVNVIGFDRFCFVPSCSLGEIVSSALGAKYIWPH